MPHTDITRKKSKTVCPASKILHTSRYSQKTRIKTSKKRKKKKIQNFYHLFILAKTKAEPKNLLKTKKT
jgi:hypothetical protein